MSDKEEKMEEDKVQIESRDVVIIGSGPCGLTAALYTARAGLKPLVLHGETPGGQLTTTTTVENFPGAADVEGNDLIENMKKQSKHFGAEDRYETVLKITVQDDKTFKLSLWGDKELHAKAVIVATGARPRKLGLKSEETFWSKGVTSCATCDGYFYRGREVIVVGGGDSAVEEAMFLTRFCPKVKIVHRRDTLRASKIMAKRAEENEKIEFVWNSNVVEILGDPNAKGLQVTGVKLEDSKTGDVRTMETGGVFYAIGHIPNTDILKGLVKLDDVGYAITEPESSKTNIPGLFVAGDAKDKVYRQAITAAGSGCMAAIDCERYLSELGSEEKSSAL